MVDPHRHTPNMRTRDSVKLVVAAVLTRMTLPMHRTNELIDRVITQHAQCSTCQRMARFVFDATQETRDELIEDIQDALA